MRWDEILDISSFEEGTVISMITTEGIFRHAEIVKICCPICAEVFIGTKKHAGAFIFGHREYHKWEIEISELM